MKITLHRSDPKDSNMELVDIRTSSAFASGTPSIFTIQSPFQAFCAIASIQQLNISDYRLIVIFRSYYEIRFKQILSVLDFYDLNYEVINMDGIYKFRYYYFLIKFSHRSNKYKRLFVGDFRYLDPYIVGLRYVSDHADVVNIDDGNITISLLQDLCPEPFAISNIKRLQEIMNMKQISPSINLLTVYKDLPNSKYQIEILDLVNLIRKDKLKNQLKSGVFFIGTNSDTFCEKAAISQDYYLECLKLFLKTLKKEYSGSSVYYIPHGLDSCSEIKNICNEIGVIYHKTDNMVELELLRRQFCPQAVYAFSSSALYNLKMIYPETLIINVLLKLQMRKDVSGKFKKLSNYYESVGISALEIGW